MGRSSWEGWEPSRRQRGHRRRDHGGPWSAATSGPWGPTPWAQFFGPEWVGGHPARAGRRPRVRRGDVRFAILGVLHDAGEPMNGYQVTQEIADRTEGMWKPSPGSIYPTMAQLEDEGLLEDAPTGRKAVQLTDQGRQYAADHAVELDAVWEPFETAAEDAEGLGLKDLKHVLKHTAGAFAQVMQAGTPEQRERAVQVLDETRRKLYGILAEDPEDDDLDDTPGER